MQSIIVTLYSEEEKKKLLQKILKKIKKNLKTYLSLVKTPAMYKHTHFP
jgi:hypothetical protein